MLHAEDELIHNLVNALHCAGDAITLGPGDDTAIISPPKNKQLLYTIDCLVEGVHFSFDYASPQDIGWKALAVNLSDIAAMGGEPYCAVISIIMGKDIKQSTLQQIYQGINECSQKFNCPIAGGNISSAKKGLVIDIALLGTCHKGKAWLRSRGKAGNKIAVTGPLGMSHVGYELLSHDIDPTNEFQRQCIKAHLRPNPRLDIVHPMLNASFVNAAMDLSDGLSSDLIRMCRASGCGAKINIDTVNPPTEMLEIASRLHRNPVDWILHGGEDYQLLLAVDHNTFIPEYLNQQLIFIGELITDYNVWIGNKLLEPKGWDHTINLKEIQ